MGIVIEHNFKKPPKDETEEDNSPSLAEHDTPMINTASAITALLLTPFAFDFKGKRSALGYTYHGQYWLNPDGALPIAVEELVNNGKIHDLPDYFCNVHVVLLNDGNRSRVFIATAKPADDVENFKKNTEEFNLRSLTDAHLKWQEAIPQPGSEFEATELPGFDELAEFMSGGQETEDLAKEVRHHLNDLLEPTLVEQRRICMNMAAQELRALGVEVEARTDNDEKSVDIATLNIHATSNAYVATPVQKLKRPKIIRRKDHFKLVFDK